MSAPSPKFCFCFPCTSNARNNNNNYDPMDPTNPNYQSPDGFTKSQISKAVAVVLSGYDSQTAANSLGVPCDPEVVEYWVQLFRPPFFEEGMACPPALILWWMNEMAKKGTFPTNTQNNGRLYAIGASTVLNSQGLPFTSNNGSGGGTVGFTLRSAPGASDVIIKNADGSQTNVRLANNSGIIISGSGSQQQLQRSSGTGSNVPIVLAPGQRLSSPGPPGTYCPYLLAQAQAQAAADQQIQGSGSRGRFLQ